MLTFDDKGGWGGSKKPQKPAYVIHGCSLKEKVNTWTLLWEYPCNLPQTVATPKRLTLGFITNYIKSK